MVNYKLNPIVVDWENDDSYIFFNPKLGKEKQKLVKINKIPQELGMIWVGSSGTTDTDSIKLVGLSKKAFLVSAKSVCNHLKVTANDIWLNVLPRFHVGGLSVEARSFVSGCKINVKESLKFDYINFIDVLNSNKVTICSLVPTQVYELIKNNINAPKSLRVLYVGGGELESKVYQKAVTLGWPIVITYGMTEACSSVASSLLEDIGSPTIPALKILPHIEAKTDEQLNLFLKGESICYGSLSFSSQSIDFKQNKTDWFKTNDLVHLLDDQIKFVARAHQQLKISGEIVNLNYLNLQFEKIKSKNNNNFKSIIISNKNLKYENQIDLLVEGIKNLNLVDKQIKSFNEIVPKFQRINNIYFKSKLSSNTLGKINTSV